LIVDLHLGVFDPFVVAGAGTLAGASMKPSSVVTVATIARSSL